jgi:hypothetical protein
MMFAVWYAAVRLLSPAGTVAARRAGPEDLPLTASAGPESPPQSPTGVPAGWYPNPENPAQQRYWDGQQWSAHTADATASSPTRPSQSLAARNRRCSNTDGARLHG